LIKPKTKNKKPQLGRLRIQKQSFSQVDVLSFSQIICRAADFITNAKPKLIFGRKSGDIALEKSIDAGCNNIDLKFYIYGQRRHSVVGNNLHVILLIDYQYFIKCLKYRDRGLATQMGAYWRGSNNSVAFYYNYKK